MKTILPFMVGQGEQKHITENYVSVPPALTITDEAGSLWTLGFIYGKAPKGEFAFNVLKDGVDTGETASRIERRKNQIWIFTANGWKRMYVNKSSLLRIYAVGARTKQIYDNISVLNVNIYLDGPDIIPILSFSFIPTIGGLHDLRASPITCLPNRWLTASVEPNATGVEVAGYLGDNYVRGIPISQRGTK